jgi:acyl dehydratase
MGRALVDYRFRRLPSAFRFYPRAIFGQRESLIPEGQTVPRLQASAESIEPSAGHLRRYREVCGFADDGLLPLTYPHVLAMPLFVAILTARAFPVRLMGLVHVATEIHQKRPLPATGRYQMHSWVEGFRNVDRGHEFDVWSELSDRDGVVWQEKVVALARRPASSAGAARSARQTLRYEKPAPGDLVSAAEIEAPAAVGRRYGLLSGDLNPIHIGDYTARRFGFNAAVAHGMWSMARSLAALGAETRSVPLRATVEFKLPLFLPGQARLEHWRRDDRHVFVLKDREGQRPHLAGDLQTDLPKLT